MYWCCLVLYVLSMCDKIVIGWRELYMWGFWGWGMREGFEDEISLFRRIVVVKFLFYVG